MNRIVPVLFCGAIALLMSCGDTPYKKIARGYRFVRLSARLAEDFDWSLKKAMADVHASCKAKHGVKTPGFDKCVLPLLRVVRAWTGVTNGQSTGKGVLSLLQAAQKVTKLAIDAVFDYVVSHKKECGTNPPPKKCSADWKAGMKPATCGLWTIVEAGIKAGAYKATKDPTYLAVKTAVVAFACN
jgi:hypothetical protein